MEKNNLMTIILGVLVLVAAVQAFQLSGLGDKIEEGSVSASSSVTAKATTSNTAKRSGATLPSSLDNLPNMVGGC